MRLTFGRYIPYNSLLHKIDPRMKIFMLLYLIATVFLKDGFTGYILIGVFLFILFIISRLPFKMLWVLFKPIFFMVFILFLVNCFLIKGSDIGFYWGGGGSHHGVSWFVVSEKSILLSCYLGIRIYFMILITMLITATTQPVDLTIGLEDLMSPLKIIRFPVSIIAQIIAIALRMIPTLIDEAGRIMKAQASRGIDFRNGGFRDKIKSAVSLIIPLLVSAFQKAEDLAYAMDARGYDPKGKRTRYRKYSFRFADLCLFLFTIGFVTFIILTVYLDLISGIHALNWLHNVDKFVT